MKCLVCAALAIIFVSAEVSEVVRDTELRKPGDFVPNLGCVRYGSYRGKKNANNGSGNANIAIKKDVNFELKC